MRVAYLDCFSGVSGDMFLGALVNAGVPRSVMEQAVAMLGIGSLAFETVDRSGISATKVNVLDGDHLAEAEGTVQRARAESSTVVPAESRSAHEMPGAHAHPHVRPNGSEATNFLFTDTDDMEQAEVHGRSLPVIRDMILASELPPEVKSLAIQTFELLGRSEAKIHNVPVESVHFHEVGAVDAIVDVVAAAAGIVHLGVDVWHCSPLNVGGGTVRCAHGVFPVPAPATADLLRGAPTYSAHVRKELVTPTGAALVRALTPTFGPQPPMTVEHVGYGAGSRNPVELPNVLRLSVGNSTEITHSGEALRNSGERPAYSSRCEPVTVLEAALDDATPQLLAYVAEQAMQMGALDVMLTPVIMKKGRPGTLLTLLTDAAHAAGFEDLLLRETTTLGIRSHEERRTCLERRHIAVQTPYGAVRVKTGLINGETVNAHPEFEDCRSAAQAAAVPLKQVQAAAMAAYTLEQREREES